MASEGHVPFDVSRFPADNEDPFTSDQPPHPDWAPPSAHARDVLAWDGILPLLVSSSPLILSICFPDADPATVGFFAVGVIPVSAALIRAHRGSFQLARLFPDAPPVGRQFVFALAIIVVFFFESVTCVFHCRGNQPLERWLIPLALYALYFLLAYVALRPCPSRDER